MEKKFIRAPMGAKTRMHSRHSPLECYNSLRSSVEYYNSPSILVKGSLPLDEFLGAIEKIKAKHGEGYSNINIHVRDEQCTCYGGCSCNAEDYKVITLSGERLENEIELQLREEKENRKAFLDKRNAELFEARERETLAKLKAKYES